MAMVHLHILEVRQVTMIIRELDVLIASVNLILVILLIRGQEVYLILLK